MPYKNDIPERTTGRAQSLTEKIEILRLDLARFEAWRDGANSDDARANFQAEADKVRAQLTEAEGKLQQANEHERVMRERANG